MEREGRKAWAVWLCMVPLYSVVLVEPRRYDSCNNSHHALKRRGCERRKMSRQGIGRCGGGRVQDLPADGIGMVKISLQSNAIEQRLDATSSPYTHTHIRPSSSSALGMCKRSRHSWRSIVSYLVFFSPLGFPCNCNATFWYPAISSPHAPQGKRCILISRLSS